MTTKRWGDFFNRNQRLVAFKIYRRKFIEALDAQEDKRMGIMGELSVMNETGDTKTIWDSDNQDEVDAARVTFDSLRKKGYMIYTVKKDGEQGEQMRKFDPLAEKMIAVPPIVAG